MSKRSFSHPQPQTKGQFKAAQDVLRHRAHPQSSIDYRFQPDAGLRRPPQKETPVSVGNWILTFIIASIPVGGLLSLLFWACSSKVEPSKRNFARSYLLLVAIVTALVGIAIIITVFIFKVNLLELVARMLYYALLGVQTQY
ncbi:MAG: hypothetical protein LBU04_06005 [Christensenellaceae bacterium]|jgi:hypothetical protein|nr:hypothetical protein [Christensenellaceae bacterium]